MKRATFLYGNSTGFSGQRFASELLIAGLRARGWRIDEITTPALEREKKAGALAFARMGVDLARSWGAASRHAFASDIFCANVGLTKVALVRDGLPLLMRTRFGARPRTFISLHGNVFMDWTANLVEARLLLELARNATMTTVTGPNQRQKLITLGVAPEQVTVMDNTCTMPPLSRDEVAEKQGAAGPLRVLYLGSLIETKGYPELVEALARLATSDGAEIDAVLCGRVVMASDRARFQTHEAASEWISAQVEAINRSRSVRLRWVPGAQGAAKAALFRWAQAFVLPSRYRVEAQPIALLEALSAGCAAVTTRVGEIPSTVGPDQAILLSHGEPDEIAQALARLQVDHQERQRLAFGGHRHFLQRFSYEAHIDRWEAILLDRPAEAGRDQS